MLKRDCGKEDLDWDTDRKRLGSELSGDAIIELRAEGGKEREKEAGQEIDYHDYQAVKIGQECVLFHSSHHVKTQGSFDISTCDCHLRKM